MKYVLFLFITCKTKVAQFRRPFRDERFTRPRVRNAKTKKPIRAQRRKRRYQYQSHLALMCPSIEIPAMLLRRTASGTRISCVYLQTDDDNWSARIQVGSCMLIYRSRARIVFLPPVNEKPRAARGWHRRRRSPGDAFLVDSTAILGAAKDAVGERKKKEKKIDPGDAG